MSWVGRPEARACCPGPHGPVRDDEQVARLLHDKIDQPEKARFQRDGQLFPPRKRTHSNQCAKQDGASVVRCSELTEDEIRAKAAAQARRQPDRISRGAVVARVAALRAIRLEDAPDRQVVFVYDDPINPGEPLHAVIRVDDSLAEADFVDIREQVLKWFSSPVTP